VAQVQGYDSAGVELTAGGAVTVVDNVHFIARNSPTPASGNTITNQYGFYCQEMTSGGTLNYAFYSAGSTPSYFGGPISAGAGKLTVDANGNITKLNNVTTNFPAANAAGYLKNDGSGNFSYDTPAGGSGADLAEIMFYS
jgi:hypothetical protein